ncbi:hypothetical protein JJB71_13120 [Clostridium perfringens]|uniref:competence protein CoiA n=1 Tax=Clostridium perfringens TaxID=1502 RepID=UPI001ABB5C04|nr:competence protein CoiA family protein [Clostridium perfringens]MBO3398479.1 hypothetical protein [Clostridium perfringens]
MITCQVGKKKIDTFSYEPKQLREWSNKGLLRCPVCRSKMIYNHGEFKIPHFKHEKNCDCPDIYSEGVTEEHIKGIELLHNWLQKQEGVTNIELEKWISETKQRPDIYFEYENKPYVIEFQCSPIATKFLERRELYRLNEINDIWILGCDKYDINNIYTIHKANIKEKIFVDIKYKAIESSIAQLDNNIYYLSKNRMIKASEIGNYRNLKTIFAEKINSKNLKDIKINNIIKNEEFYTKDESSELDFNIIEFNRLKKYLYTKYNNLRNILGFEINMKHSNKNIYIEVFGCMGRLSYGVDKYSLNKIKELIENTNFKYSNYLEKYLELQNFCNKMNLQYGQVKGYTEFQIEMEKRTEFLIIISFNNDHHNLTFEIDNNNIKILCEYIKNGYKYDFEIENIKYKEINTIKNNIKNHCSNLLREMKYGGNTYEKTKTV